MLVSLEWFHRFTGFPLFCFMNNVFFGWECSVAERCYTVGDICVLKLNFRDGICNVSKNMDRFCLVIAMFNIVYFIFDIVCIFIWHKICNIFFLFRKFIAFTMDATVWKFLPFEIIEIIRHWLPLSVLMRFKLVCKQWSILLQDSFFLIDCDCCAKK